MSEDKKPTATHNPYPIPAKFRVAIASKTSGPKKPGIALKTLKEHQGAVAKAFEKFRPE